MKTIEHIFESALVRLSGAEIEDKRYLLAVSGGIDSMTMASLFLHCRLKPRFAIAHVNFSLRPGDCDEDMKLVQDWGARYGIEVYTAIFDTHAYAAGRGISTQMAARELRYGFFDRTMAEHGYDLLAVAHNMDDSAETVFVNMTRGTGLRGMAGISECNGRIIRPLLGVSRAQIREYVAGNEVQYRDDRTNFESHYTRNRIRNVIFPEFCKINPSFLDTMQRNSRYFGQACDVLDDMYGDIRAAVCHHEGDMQMIDVATLRMRGHVEYWLFRILEEYGFNSGQVSDIARCVEDDETDSTGKRFISGSHELLFDRGILKIYPLQEDEGGSFTIGSPGEYCFRGTRFSVEFFPRTADFDPKKGIASDRMTSQLNGCHTMGLSHNADVLYLSGDHVKMPLVCRGWKNADRFRPFGMRSGSKKLSDLFTDLKLDLRAKSVQPVLTSADGDIICLPGLRIADDCRITSATTAILKIEMRHH